LKKPSFTAGLALLLGWSLMLYVVPLGVGLAVGAVPLRLVSSGILFDQVAVSLNGYRAILWSPVVTGILLAITASRLGPSPFRTSLGLAGATVAATLLLAGGVLGIGPGSLLLVGTDLRWIGKLCVAAGGLTVGLVGPMLLKADAEDHSLDLRAIRRDYLLTGVLLGALILLLGPGAILGKVMTGAGSWLGSLFWVVGL
jgi:hypothetical protein